MVLCNPCFCSSMCIVNYCRLFYPVGHIIFRIFQFYCYSCLISKNINRSLTVCKYLLPRMYHLKRNVIMFYRFLNVLVQFRLSFSLVVCCISIISFVVLYIFYQNFIRSLKVNVRLLEIYILRDRPRFNVYIIIKYSLGTCGLLYTDRQDFIFVTRRKINTFAAGCNFTCNILLKRTSSRNPNLMIND